MIKKNLYVTEQQDKWLRIRSIEKGTPYAEIVRRALDDFMLANAKEDKGERTTASETDRLQRTNG